MCNILICFGQLPISNPPLACRNFVLSTVSSTVVHVNAQGGVLQMLLREHCEALHAVACHPKQPVVAMGSHSGILKVWDYDRKLPICSRVFETERQIQCITYDAQGNPADAFVSLICHY